MVLVETKTRDNRVDGIIRYGSVDYYSIDRIMNVLHMELSPRVHFVGDNLRNYLHNLIDDSVQTAIPYSIRDESNETQLFSERVYRWLLIHLFDEGYVLSDFEQLVRSFEMETNSEIALPTTKLNFPSYPRLTTPQEVFITRLIAIGRDTQSVVRQSHVELSNEQQEQIELGKVAEHILYKAHLAYVVTLAAKFSNFADAEQRNDFIQEGNLLMCQVLDRYEYRRGTPFKSYVRHRVVGYYQSQQKKALRERKKVMAFGYTPSDRSQIDPQIYFWEREIYGAFAQAMAELSNTNPDAVAVIRLKLGLPISGDFDFEALADQTEALSNYKVAEMLGISEAVVRKRNAEILVKIYDFLKVYLTDRSLINLWTGLIERQKKWKATRREVNAQNYKKRREQER